MSQGRMRAATFAFSGVLLAAAGIHANAQSFDGITIIELADEAGENAIIGRRLGPADTGNFIVTFVSARGSYATLVRGRNSNRLCVAWAVEGSYTGASITFGVAASTASMKATTPKICQPFALTHVGPGMVRVAASNSFHPREGPLSPAAETVTYSRERRVVAHVPLVAFE